MPFIATDSDIWEKQLSSHRFDVYHLPEYCLLEAAELGGEALAWWAEVKGRNFLIPLIRRKVQLNGCSLNDLVSPYGYPGILYASDVPAKDVFEAIHQFHHEAALADYVSSFIRLNPFFNDFKLQGISHVSQQFQGATVSVDLNKPMEWIRKAYSLNHKRNINRLHKKGFTVRVNHWNHLDDFIAIYLETMRRKHAGKRYFFSKDYFDRLKQFTRSSLFLVTIHTPEGAVAAGGLFTLVHDLAQFHLGGTAAACLHLSPSKLMIDAAIVASKKLGVLTMHLGGGYGSSNVDGLFRFKDGFGQTHHEFSTLRFIHNPEVYYELSAEFNQDNTPGSYFPAYRS